MKTLEELVADKILDLVHYVLSKIIKPDMTLTDMKKQVIQMIDQAPVNKFQKWMLKKIYPLQLKTLKRWRD